MASTPDKEPIIAQFTQRCAAIRTGRMLYSKVTRNGPKVSDLWVVTIDTIQTWKPSGRK